MLSSKLPFLLSTGSYVKQYKRFLHTFSSVAYLPRYEDTVHKASAARAPCMQTLNVGPSFRTRAQAQVFIAPYPPRPLAFLRGAIHAARVPGRRARAHQRARRLRTPALRTPHHYYYLTVTNVRLWRHDSGIQLGGGRFFTRLAVERDPLN